MNATAAIRASIARAYDVFARYPQPTALDAAPTRDPAKVLRQLTSSPLRELGCDQIGPFSGWAMTTVGTDHDYKHFLPRILELAVGENCPHLGMMPGTLAGRISYAGFEAWPEEEQATVRAVFEAVWEQALAESPDATDAEEWLCAALLIGEPLGPKLERWLGAEGVNPGLQLASAVVREATRQPGEARVFWSEVGEGLERPFFNWLVGGGVRARLFATLPEAGEHDWLVQQALQSFSSIH